MSTNTTSYHYIWADKLGLCHSEGPFPVDAEVVRFDGITGQHISKLGIHLDVNYALDIETGATQDFFVILNGKPFQIGIRGMLELEDVNITSIIFPQATTDKVSVIYQVAKDINV